MQTTMCKMPHLNLSADYVLKGPKTQLREVACIISVKWYRRLLLGFDMLEKEFWLFLAYHTAKDKVLLDCITHRRMYWTSAALVKSVVLLCVSCLFSCQKWASLTAGIAGMH